MSSPSPANVHRDVRILLQTMCKFLVPIFQRACGDTAKGLDLDQILPGIEADNFVSALENFISDIVSRRSQDKRHNVGMKADLNIDPVENLDGAHWLWDISVLSNDVALRAAWKNTENLKHTHCEQRIVRSVTRILDNEEYQTLESELQELKAYIDAKFPTRVLRFEPHNSELKISLADKADVYNYLSTKFKASHYGNRFKFFLDIDDTNDWIPKHAKYAILSHTWTQTPGELTYNDWQKGPLDVNQPKSQKLVNFCKVAWQDYGFNFGWIDTVCINKESSAELDESIRSMYTWYRNADVCITYLGGTSRSSHMYKDPWFSRGWTFQELVAPDYIKFYNTYWKKLTRKYAKNDTWHPLILESIQRATTMTPQELRDIRQAPISRRMQIAAKRKVTRGEDIAYCLMGVFGVSISTEYGEGAERAFFRLVREIFNSTKHVLDIFNWAGFSGNITSLFPSSPSSYDTRSSDNLLSHRWRPIEPLILTHLGLRIPILLMSALSYHQFMSPEQSKPIGDYSATVRVASNAIYRVLYKMVSGKEDKNTYIFGVLNVEGDGTHIRIPKRCLAVLFKLKQPWYKQEALFQGYIKEATATPIVFTLEKNGNNTTNKNHYKMERSELENHGMEIVTLNL